MTEVMTAAEVAQPEVADVKAVAEVMPEVAEVEARPMAVITKVAVHMGTEVPVKVEAGGGGAADGGADGGGGAV